MKRFLEILTIVQIVFALAGCAATSQPPVQTPAVKAALPSDEALFVENCAACHGIRGIGTQQGPPLVNKIYEPAHHGDLAFVFAAQNGVKQHHWQFGDMPKQPQVSEADIRQIISYVRKIQREAGIR